VRSPNRNSLRPLLATLLAVTSSACAPPAADEIAARPSAIVGGTTAANAAIVKLNVGCTATVLAPNLLLTARHCVAELPAGSFFCDEFGAGAAPPGTDGEPPPAPQFGALKDPASILIEANGSSTDPTPPAAPSSPHGSRILVPDETSRCQTDIALVVLEPAIDDPVTAPIRLDGAAGVHVGEAITEVGWGLTDDGDHPSALQEHAASVLGVGPVPATSTASAIWKGFFTVGGGLCYGDSGGPGLSASGAVVGVASFIDFPQAPLGQATDCSNAGILGGYAATTAESAFLEQGFLTAGAVPWLEGQPDPRAALAPFEAVCGADADCQSNACVLQPDGARTCSHGCADHVGATPCPEGYACQAVDGRQRCQRSIDAVSDAPPPPSADEGGCSVADERSPRPSGATTANLLAALLGLLWLRRRRPARMG
jgi:MYXO-CTERM domain-containing protein